jgi:hypothetical protein
LGTGSSFRIGARVPIGAHLYLNRKMFDVFVQVAPSIGLRFYPSFGGDSFSFPFAVGFRFWLR